MPSTIWWIFWKKRPANFNFIWLEWYSYNSSIQFHIVWSCSSIFKLKSSPAQGWVINNSSVMCSVLIDIVRVHLCYLVFIINILLKRACWLWPLDWFWLKKCCGTPPIKQLDTSKFLDYKVLLVTSKSWFVVVAVVVIDISSFFRINLLNFKVLLL